MFVPIAKDPSGEMKHLAARQTSLYFLLQVFKSSYNERVILHNEETRTLKYLQVFKSSYNERVRDSKQTTEVDASATAVLEGGFV